MTLLDPPRNGARRFVLVTLGAVAAITLFFSPAVALGQLNDRPDGQIDETEAESVSIDSVIGLELDPELPNFDLINPEWLNADWEDPIERFELADEPLAPVPSFDFWTLHPSEVFETGIANLSVSNAPDLTVEEERHLRSLQTIATGELAWETAAVGIAAELNFIDSTNDAISVNNDVIAQTEDELLRARGRLADIASSDADEVAEQDTLNSGIDDLNAVIIELAIQAFTGESSDLELLAEDPFSTAPIERRIVTNQVREFQRADIESLEGLIRESEGRRAVLAEQRATIEAANIGRLTRINSLNRENGILRRQVSDARETIVELEERQVELEATVELAEAFSEVSALHYQAAYHQRLASFVSGTDIPLVALNAYVRAANTLTAEDRSCGIHWSQLAGIGRVESAHGYFGDSTLDVNGNTTVDIQGLALDGRVLSGSTTGDVPAATGRSGQTGGVSRLALILDTDGGRLDGDSVYDRAVGPMQFIPTTWRLFEPDGNGDGQSDPQNVYDAALAAARYLCDAPGSMLAHEGEQRAYFAYNHDLEYSRNVTRTGRRYHELLDVSPESQAFAAFALTPTPEEQEAIDRAEAAAAAKDEFVNAEADKAVQAAITQCEAQPASATTEEAAEEEPVEEEPVAEEPVDCTAVGESVREAAEAAAALAYVEPIDGEASE